VAGPRPSITCVDCGGNAYLLTQAPEDDRWQPGDVVAYRCKDCLDRWDIELTIEDIEGPANPDEI
jgi:hypothetical protein